MRRRDLLKVAAGAVALRPLAAGAQQTRLPVIGFLNSAAPEPSASKVAAFRRGLGEIGYVEGKNVAIEYRWAENRYDRLPALAKELAARAVDLIVATGAPPSALAAKSATATIPIVFGNAADPVETGIVASLARPGGNLTGVTFIAFSLTAKRLGLIAELAPQASVIGLLANPNNVGLTQTINQAKEAASGAGRELRVVEAGTEAGIDAAFSDLHRSRIGALIVAADLFLAARCEQLVADAARDAIPAIYDSRSFVDAGGLISYGSSIEASYRQVGVYAGKILRGAKPADLPVEEPTKFELVINLKTAKALGLTVPQLLLAQANEVIE